MNNRADKMADNISEIKTTVCFLKDFSDQMKKDIKHLENINKFHEKKTWQIEHDISEIKQNLESINDRYEKSTIIYFFKRNWWKITGFLISLATIFGAIGEYLYHLPPPVKN